MALSANIVVTAGQDAAVTRQVIGVADEAGAVRIRAGNADGVRIRGNAGGIPSRGLADELGRFLGLLGSCL